MRIFDFQGRKMDFTTPRVMGILNVTPDSFYDGLQTSPPVSLSKMERGNRGSGGKGGEAEARIAKVADMIADGAYIIDIGAVSTRPGASEVSVEEEKKRLIPVLKEIRKRYTDLIVSVDTYRAEIARIAAGEGADMINDISGGTFDHEMLPTIIHLGIPFIIMHIQGTPQTMQQNPEYKDVVQEVKGFLLKQAMKLEAGGHQKIIIDPGFGFGKTVEHNYQLLTRLDEFANAGYPVLAGLSRKSMINRVLGTKPVEALNGTTVLNTIALLNGAAILRVHDVKEAVEAVRLVNFANFVPSK
ncbi:MAG: dihydropteroate synthase [Bacteroidales bacterium]|nr:dihydropteroate synthase [Bacteroidales bacterium]